MGTPECHPGAGAQVSGLPGGLLTFWTGLGLSLSTATYLRSVLLLALRRLIIVLIVERLSRIRAIFRAVHARVAYAHTNPTREGIGLGLPPARSGWYEDCRRNVGHSYVNRSSDFKKETEQCNTKS